MGWKRQVRKITFGQVAVTFIMLAAFYLLLIATFEFFQHWQYFQFSLLCVMGIAFLVITFILKH